MTLSDEDQLRYAARAVGREQALGRRPPWNPRNNNADAFELLVCLGVMGCAAVALLTPEQLAVDPCAAAREAVFNAAVTVGRATP